ncbi:MAG: hypothetical protein JW833_06650, partial [Prolixibacteraceae bacterium]|nr:hypothetical protein [Prolixibacteraceae bacterium]
MKKFCFVIILLAGSFILSAQTETNKKLNFFKTNNEKVKQFNFIQTDKNYGKPNEQKLNEQLKSANVTKQKLDSALYGDWDNDLQLIIYWDKYLMTYNSMGLITAMLNYELDEFGNWIGYSKDEYAYDANGNQTLYTEFDWDSDLNDWLGDEKMENTFDESGNILVSINYYTHWETGVWVPESKQENQYNNSGLPLV